MGVSFIVQRKPGIRLWKWWPEICVEVTNEYCTTKKQNKHKTLRQSSQSKKHALMLDNLEGTVWWNLSVKNVFFPSAFAAGHCYEPFVKYGNLTSSDSTWAVGAVVEFACDPGYTLEQGSVTIECMDPDNPQWNETEPACRGLYNCAHLRYHLF